MADGETIGVVLRPLLAPWITLGHYPVIDAVTPVLLLLLICQNIFGIARAGQIANVDFSAVVVNLNGIDLLDFYLLDDAARVVLVTLVLVGGGAHANVGYDVLGDVLMQILMHGVRSHA